MTPTDPRSRPGAGEGKPGGGPWQGAATPPAGSLTQVDGLLVGHATDREGLTGCTVVLCPEGATCAVDVRGGAPGTRETDLLGAGRLVQQVHAVCLAGGSAFGLAAAHGVMTWLEERGYGFDTGVARVPIVPAAILFDLAVGDPRARPDAAMGYAACQAASREPVVEGSVGAGTGAVIGTILGPAGARKGGVGSAARFLPNGWTVAALVVLNCYGGVRDPETGRWLVGPPPALSATAWPGAQEGQRGAGPAEAGPAGGPSGAGRDAGTGTSGAGGPHGGGPGSGEARPGYAGRHTTLAVVATDAPLPRDDLYRIAQVAQTGLARVIDPVHTWVDGDVVFALATGRRPGTPTMDDRMAIAATAAHVTATAALRAALCAESLGGIPAVAGGDASR
ncbi:peptidase S58 DmpA [Thermaerobacter marianensis DSM 12885]|uniref:Peptidase S58 DmpA n=1 Tax=Thermaerobacter marianensis (strain ATCC 700841 / DSM 12885 / JCM 10246 / 7p75a) TaxID=644966 RepID=E6SLJ8_THEM7|nr:P1 family peptidase [Thermaerobacter marianensis]ADU50265.1 peptidase S58 DmpA [Thermaerobacter marianensis DSM 12885]